ncbi:hypothetical protein D3C87_1475330 [compost metagenome]
MRAIELVVPVDAEKAQHIGQDASGGIEQEPPQYASHHRRDRIGPEQHGRIGGRRTDQPAHCHCQDQRQAHRHRGHRQREHCRATDRGQIGRFLEQPRIVQQAHEAGRETERVFPFKGRFDRLAGRPDEKQKRDDQLRRHQQIGQPLGGKDCAFGIHRPDPRERLGPR